ncbi:MAG: Dihydroorotate dehydrogenase B (NAD(+)), electron transfer subunit [Candidatus Omnitrophica bacterium]|nr:Dihydroorotate dehydrogenase B (NAD(+)), electron transfer subunit [Candidatus Omnitrophota bacterium]
MWRERCRVLDNQRVAPGHHVLRLRARRIAGAARPGQFVQVMCSDSTEPLLPRPFSFLTAGAGTISFLYHIVGQGTEILSRVRKGEELWITGPLGRGWDTAPQERVAVLVGGGVGIPPLYHLAQSLKKLPAADRPAIRVLLGARDKSLLLCEKDFKKLGVQLECATDDGSKGKKGYVTALLDPLLALGDPAGTRIYTCGPTPMLKAVSALALKHGAACEVSVEVPMACGYGACLGCAIKVQDAACAPGAHRYAIACCEGPVFPAGEIVWA